MKLEKKHLIYLFISVLTSILVILIYEYTIFLRGLELGSLDHMFYMRNEPPTEGIVSKNPRINENIIIIGIDEQAIQKFGRWPWKRTVHANFLKFLSKAKPAAVFFDVFFTEYSDNKNEDAIFFQEIKNFTKNNKLFFDYPFSIQSEKLDLSLVKDRYDLLKKFALPLPHNSIYLKNYNYAAIPVVEVLQSATGVGHAVIEEDSDTKYRRMPLFVKFNNELYPQVVTLIAMNYWNVQKNDVEIKLGEYIKFKNAKIRIPIKDEFGDVVDYKIKTSDIKVPIDEECKMLINYCGWPGEFKAQNQYFSYKDVFEMPAEFFKDKILFVGMYAQGIAHDVWPSPHGIMYGLEHNANAFNTLIQQDFLSYVPQKINILIILAIGLILGLVFPRIKIWQSILFILLLIIALYIVAVVVLFSKYNKIIMLSTPIIAIILCYISILIYRILTEEKEKAFIKKRFSNYVSPAVVEELLKNPKALQLGGEDRILTVFFSDVRSFTTISEQLGEPQKLVALLNEYLSAMTEIIIKYNGTLDKYVGDEIMAFWGAPVPQPDHAILACKSALAQVKYLKEVLYPKWEKEGKPLLKIGIGINTGKMTVGNMGSPNRMDYTLMGDEVNLGSRLEGTNKVYGTTIIISESTYEQVKDKVIARELDIIRVKGKTKPVRIFELIDLKDEEVTY